MAIVIGTDGNDRYNDPGYPGNVELKGTSLADQMYGLAGDDELVGFDGDDLLEGGQGADVLWGGDGLDLASYQGSPARVQVNLGIPSAGGGDAADDTFHEIEGVVGSAFADDLQGSDGANVLRGGGGGDVVDGHWGDDALFGEAGDDLLGGSAGSDRLDGGLGDDRLDGGEGDDLLEGGAGVDTASFRSSHTHHRAGVAADLAGGTATDLAGGTAAGAAPVGSDRLSGIENLEGSYRDDRLAGDGGANALKGAPGADVLEGRGGADRFVYGQNEDSYQPYDSPPAAADRILDFSQKQGDRLDLSAVDADAQAAGDQAFRFVGQDAFTAAGQVRFFKAGGDTVVEVNTDDAAPGAEMRIELDPVVNLQATDFLL
jgi:Ca2+-binding RTX toxin-like protein